MKQKLVKIIIRGVEFQVTPDFAREMQQKEREMIRKEWDTNQLP